MRLYWEDEEEDEDFIDYECPLGHIEEGLTTNLHLHDMLDFDHEEPS